MSKTGIQSRWFTIVYSTGFVLVIVGIIFALIFILFDLRVELPVSRLRKSVPLQSIASMKSMEVIWERRDIYVGGVHVSDLAMQTKDGKVFLGGNTRPYYTNYGIVLNAMDGNEIGKTELIDGTFSFTTDGIAFYIGTTQGREIYKYDYQKNQRVWNQEVNDKAPCCFWIYQSQLITSWYNGSHRFSVSDGSIIEERLPEKPLMVFHIENGIYYQSGNGNIVGYTETGSEVWNAGIYEDTISLPVFRHNRVFILKGAHAAATTGKIVVVDQKTAEHLWTGDWSIISNIAVSPTRAYFLTSDGYLLGVNVRRGKVETSVKFSPDTFNKLDRYYYYNDYNVAYDESSGLLFLALGESGQLIAFRETR